MIWRRAAILAGLALGFGLGTTTVAEGSPLVESHIGGPVFDGPTSPSVTAVFYNPAAAGLLKGTHVLIVGSTEVDLDSIQLDTINTATGDPSSTSNKSFGRQTLVGATPTTSSAS